MNERLRGFQMSYTWFCYCRIRVSCLYTSTWIRIVVYVDFIVVYVCLANARLRELVFVVSVDLRITSTWFDIVVYVGFYCRIRECLLSYTCVLLMHVYVVFYCRIREYILSYMCVLLIDVYVD